METVAFHTLGCKVNQYETEAIMELFEKEGYKSVPFDDKADIYVINTCTVTNVGDKKSRQMIRRAHKKNPQAIIIVVGCYAQIAPKEIAQIEGVNMIIGTNQRNQIVRLLQEYEKKQNVMIQVNDIMKVRDFEEMNISTVQEKTRAYLKIQEGCNRFCSYCIIPYTRGPIRSRSPENIMKEIRTLVNNGFKEIVLTGIHVGSYGKDIKNMEIDLVDLIKDIHSIEGLERIRLSSIEPTFVTKHFIQTIQALPKVCRHFHLSLQSGSNRTLQRMNRKYTKEIYQEKVELLRYTLKDVALTTDVIVGFPGETTEDFEESYEFIKNMKFSKIHVFPYSPKKGTKAAKYPNQIPNKIKEKRRDQMMKLGEKMEIQFLSNHIGRIHEVLVETRCNGSNMFEGHTSNYMKVKVCSSVPLENTMQQIKMIQQEKDYLIGKII
ncbi:MAG: tRNA (N(6)-L-threonylcarbamoyladenosine(37)-C(2))-methylthiotransferase MtaB [Epulopiscium sp.]|nr:tRNA (N(6)-L-threonylcarbamoyladenosine(37)-C(2))-methylthiotransferase MtaB [Candidatus Epulonipiscium sp.]